MDDPNAAQIAPKAPIAVVDPAHAKKVRRLNSLVIQAGLATTALALFGVWAWQYYGGYNIMGLYGNYIIPAGAILVGIVASSGYGLASWFGGLKIHRTQLIVILLLQAVAYFVAQYIEFRSLGPLYHRATGLQVGFFEYFHFTAINIAFTEHGKTGAPLGLWGYGVRFLDVVGFAGGSLIIPAALWKAPYCDACERYMKTRQIALFPASIPVRKVGKKDAEGQAAYGQEQQEALQKGTAHVEFIKKCAESNDSRGFLDYVAATLSHKKETAKLPSRIDVSLVHCKSCAAGYLKAGILSGQGKQIQRHELPSITLTPDFVRAIQPTKPK